MYRFAEKSLDTWASGSSRKPLVIRGARQVGKTYLVREFARKNGYKLVEYNFDRNPEKIDLFKKSAIESLRLLEADLGYRIQDQKSLLFLDEIQAAPEVFACLRYWYEECPELHLVAAGSLLDFILADHQFSMPVGRIDYLYLGPLTLDEYLLESEYAGIHGFLCEWEGGDPIPEALHQKGLEAFRKYLAVGGMPAPLQRWQSEGVIEVVQREQQSIVQSYQDDFSKYGNKINTEGLRRVFQGIPLTVGRKVKYSRLDAHSKSAQVRSCLEMLRLARVIHLVHHSSANGVPLSAEVNHRDFKGLFIDIGLLNSMMNVNWNEILLADDLVLVHQGLLCEQFVGQHLLYAQEDYRIPELYYWNREKRNSSAEIDYLVQHGSSIVPIEVKAGKTGRMKSLGLFIEEKGTKTAVRFNSDHASVVEFNGAKLISLPFYAIGQLKRLL